MNDIIRKLFLHYTGTGTLPHGMTAEELLGAAFEAGVIDADEMTRRAAAVDAPERPRKRIDDLRDWIDRGNRAQEAWNEFLKHIDVWSDEMERFDLEEELFDDVRDLLPWNRVRLTVEDDADKTRGAMWVMISVTLEIRPPIDTEAKLVIDDALKERGSVLADMGESQLSHDIDEADAFSIITWITTVEVGD